MTTGRKNADVQPADPRHEDAEPTLWIDATGTTSYDPQNRTADPDRESTTLAMIERAIHALRMHGTARVVRTAVFTAGPERIPIVFKPEVHVLPGPPSIPHNTDERSIAEMRDRLGTAHPPDPPLEKRDDLIRMILACLERPRATRSRITNAMRILSAVSATLTRPEEHVVVRSGTPWRGPNATAMPMPLHHPSTGIVPPLASLSHDLPMDADLVRIMPDVVTAIADRGRLVLRPLAWASHHIASMRDPRTGHAVLLRMRDRTPDPVSALRILAQARDEPRRLDPGNHAPSR